eukprot:350149-Chlamydomonas_euryale.AAC.16
MDRAVLNEANFTNAVLERAVLTRSDLTGATITGADFSNALVDRTQQLVGVGWGADGCGRCASAWLHPLLLLADALAAASLYSSPTFPCGISHAQVEYFVCVMSPFLQCCESFPVPCLYVGSTYYLYTLIVDCPTSTKAEPTD